MTKQHGIFVEFFTHNDANFVDFRGLICYNYYCRGLIAFILAFCDRRISGNNHGGSKK